MVEPSLTELLRTRASEQPDATAYTFIDYEVDPDGYAEGLTWAEVHHSANAVAEELRLCGSAGDRAAILAPQGFAYISAFLGALQAGFIAVPLPAPQFGGHDERVSSALRDCSPTVILTTSAVVGAVAPYAGGENGDRAPVIIEVDALDLDSPRPPDPVSPESPKIAYLQYTSGSTRRPAGVVVTHRNVVINVNQAAHDYFGGDAPEGTVLVSWLPFYHDMGLIKGICGPLVVGHRAVIMSPMAFLQRPARWMQMLATNGRTYSAAPNFALELAARRTSDDDMAGFDLADVQGVLCGSERVHRTTLKRFTERFEPYNLKESVVRASYGLAEATVYVACSDRGSAPSAVRFDYDNLSKGHAMPCAGDGAGSSELIGHGTTRSTTLRIVDPDTRTENPAGKVGEIWVHGSYVTSGYWRKPKETQRVFGGQLANPAPGTPTGPWLRTGDLGVISEEELFIVGRIKDLLIVDGSNHYPDDIEATVQQTSNGRAVAIAVPSDRTEQLVVIVEAKNRGDSDEEHNQKLRSMKREITSAIAANHRVRVADVVFVAPGSIPITSSGKVRRSACVEQYRLGGFERLDAAQGAAQEAAQ